MLRDATISPCGKYRYTLARVWNVSPVPKMLGVTALNPSRADAEVDDPTVLKLVSFGKQWGFDGYLLTNLWPFRATDPDDLFSFRGDIVEAGTRDLLIRCFADLKVKEVCCCWGTNAKKAWREKILERGDSIRRAFIAAGLKLSCLGRNQDGTPKHPLYISLSTARLPYMEAYSGSL